MWLGGFFFGLAYHLPVFTTKRANPLPKSLAALQVFLLRAIEELKIQHIIAALEIGECQSIHSVAKDIGVPRLTLQGHLTPKLSVVVKLTCNAFDHSTD
jgi:hypothetical protein